MYARIKLQNQRYLSRYSREQTVSTTAQRHLSVQVQRLDVKVFRNLTAEDIRDSVDTFDKSHQRGSDHHVPRRILRR